MKYMLYFHDQFGYRKKQQWNGGPSNYVRRLLKETRGIRMLNSNKKWNGGAKFYVLIFKQNLILLPFYFQSLTSLFTKKKTLFTLLHIPIVIVYIIFKEEIYYSIGRSYAQCVLFQELNIKRIFCIFLIKKNKTKLNYTLIFVLNMSIPFLNSFIILKPELCIFELS